MAAEKHANFESSMHRLIFFHVVLLLAVDDRGLPAEELPRVPPTAAAAAEQTIELQAGFRAELIAAEPMVTDPIAMKYDENGSAYVIEMNDYPYSNKSHDQAWQTQTSEPMGRVRFLEDTDGDGKFDKSTVFADRLSWPTGVALWKGGIYVLATPDVWYLKDTDGDGRADVRRKVFTGFRKYNVQAVMNNPLWGLDHEIYTAGASNGGEITAIRSVEQGETSAQASPAAVIRRSDFRFDPRQERFEPVSGGARFGHAQDDWGNRFLTDIRNPVQHVLFPAHYLHRNPFLRAPHVLQDVVPSGDSLAVFQISPPEAWRAINAQRLAADDTKKSPFDSTVPKGYVTSSSGVTIYRGHAYPEEFYGNAFIGEVAGNLVMRYRIEADGVTFQGERAHQKAEFLASTDNWFRPVNFINAPDGTLHVLDMYRETIEHPWSMPDDLKAQVDLTSGKDRGRIYRLVPPRYREGFVKPPVPRLGTASTKELIAELANPNSWWRETAHRLLFERQDLSQVSLLKKMLREHEMPVTRVHALWTLEGLESLSTADLVAAIKDPAAGVREHAIRLAERRLPQAPSLVPLIVDAAGDDARRVRFQAAFTLGEIEDPRVVAALAQLARRDANDPLMQTAVMSSVSRSVEPLLKIFLQDRSFSESSSGLEMISQLALMIGSKAELAVVNEFLSALSQSTATVKVAMLKNLAAGLRRAKRDLSEIISDPSHSSGPLVAAFLEASNANALDASLPQSQRLDAIALLGYDRFERAKPTLEKLLSIQHPPELQMAAVAALTSTARSDVAAILLDRFPALTPSVQAEVVNQLLQRTLWIPIVLDAVGAGTVPANLVSPNRRAAYLRSSQQEIRQRAVKVFSEDQPHSRKDVLDKYQAALALSGDAERGAPLFLKNCANCHRFGDLGFDVGPNLATIQNRSASQLLVNILDPSREVSPNFLEYNVLSVDGRISSGMIAAENANSITLRQAEGVETTIQRVEIEELRSSGKSLMPEGIEQTIDAQGMADLITYLLSLGQAP
ncbi:Cytochrome c [Novipirellula galeiformis]|uniref:Cytochrome c n=1 Tax=Novipirellula galeiformis TaxID=2528004 RepID=A0A5C6C0J9_9BACT|nr:PVC-type heme-binding CxxCH protein [Novipirellula galeiformis]TWU17497.1 Cytochrome c [Novipirellula galeiformis]